MNTAPQPEERIKVWRPQGFTGLELDTFESVPDLHIPVYFLNGYEFTVAFKSAVTMRYMKTTQYLETGQGLFFVQHPGETVGASTQGAPSTACTLRLYPEAMKNVTQALGLENDLPFFPSMLTAEKINDAFVPLVVETVRSFDRPASHLERESRLMGLLYAVLKHCSDTPPPEVRLGNEPKAVTLVKDALHSAPEMDVKLDDLASLTGLNKFYLGRVFSKEVGISPHQYQLGLRVQRAKDKLARGETLVDIAFDMGFSDQAHFTRVFKKFTLTTPGRFQRNTLTS